MIKVNLVPQDILAKARQRQLLFQASVVGGFLAVVLVLVSVGHWFGLSRLKSQLSYDEAELKRLDAIVKQVEELEKAANAVRARLGVIDDLLRGRSYYPIFMSEFARTVPAGIKVASMQTSAGPGNTLKLSISGTGATNDDIANWVRTLENNKQHFGAAELGGVSLGAETYSFSMTTVYKP